MKIDELYLNAAITVGILLAVSILTKIALRYITKKNKLGKSAQKRKNQLLKTIKLFSTILTVLLIITIWGINAGDIWIFITSIFGLVGIAFFAGWSLLSNVVGAYILFFSGNFNIGDYITYKDADNTIEGEVIEMTLFFIRLRTDNQTIANIPNSVALQHIVLVKER